MAFTTLDLLVLRYPPFLVVECILRLVHEIDLAVLLGHDGPIRVIVSYGRVHHEPAGSVSLGNFFFSPLIDGSSEANKVTELEPTNRTETEQMLEDTLVANPEMLMPGLTLVGRQTPTTGGPLDLLGVDSSGQLVVFELKRETLTRDAVTQIIDYASSLELLSDDDLAAQIVGQSGKNGIDTIDDFEEWYSQRFPDSTVRRIKAHTDDASRPRCR